MATILRKPLENQKPQFPKLNVFVGQKSILCHYYIQIRVYKMSKESLAHFSQFISVKVNKILRTSQAQYQEKLRRLRVRQNQCILMKKQLGAIAHAGKGACVN